MIVEAFEPVTEPHVLLVKEYGSREPELKCADVGTYTEVAKTPTGVEAIDVTPDTIVDVYNLQGVRVLRDAKVMDIINLPAGIYVAGGRKYVVR